MHAAGPVSVYLYTPACVPVPCTVPTYLHICLRSFVCEKRLRAYDYVGLRNYACACACEYAYVYVSLSVCVHVCMHVNECVCVCEMALCVV